MQTKTWVCDWCKCAVLQDLPPAGWYVFRYAPAENALVGGSELVRAELCEVCAKMVLAAHQGVREARAK